MNLVLNSGSNRSDEEAAIAALRESMANQAGVEYKFGRPELFSFSTPLEIEIIGYNLDASSMLFRPGAIGSQSWCPKYEWEEPVATMR